MPDFPNLEPNHEVHELAHKGDPLWIVVCPYTDPAGNHFESSWSRNGDPSTVDCLFCEFLKGGWTDHGCQDTGDRGVG